MTTPIWLIAIATAWKLANETAKIITNYKLENRKLELEQKEEK